MSRVNHCQVGNEALLSAQMKHGGWNCDFADMFKRGRGGGGQTRACIIVDATASS